jgi:hypothetical protein
LNSRINKTIQNITTMVISNVESITGIVDFLNLNPAHTALCFTVVTNGTVVVFRILHSIVGYEALISAVNNAYSSGNEVTIKHINNVVIDIV